MASHLWLQSPQRFDIKVALKKKIDQLSSSYDNILIGDFNSELSEDIFVKHMTKSIL